MNRSGSRASTTRTRSGSSGAWAFDVEIRYLAPDKHGTVPACVGHAGMPAAKARAIAAGLLPTMRGVLLMGYPHEAERTAVFTLGAGAVHDEE